MKKLSLLVAAAGLVTVLAGCATDIPSSTAMIDGPLTAAPAGWTNYCGRHAEDPGCRR